MTLKSMKYSDCDTIMDGYNPVPPPLPRRVPPVRNIYAEPFASDANAARFVDYYFCFFSIDLNYQFTSYFDKSIRFYFRLRILDYRLINSIKNR